MSLFSNNVRCHLDYVLIHSLRFTLNIGPLAKYFLSTYLQLRTCIYMHVRYIILVNEFVESIYDVNESSSLLSHTSLTNSACVLYWCVGCWGVENIWKVHSHTWPCLSYTYKHTHIYKHTHLHTHSRTHIHT